MPCPARVWFNKIEGFLITLALLAGIPSYSCASSPAKDAASMSAVPAAEAVPDSLAYYHFILGYEYNLSNAMDAALAEYTKALAYDPSSLTIHLRLAALY